MKTKKIFYRLKGEKSDFSQGFIIEETGPALLINEKEYHCYPKWFKKEDLEITDGDTEDTS